MITLLMLILSCVLPGSVGATRSRLVSARLWGAVVALTPTNHFIIDVIIISLRHYRQCDRFPFTLQVARDAICSLILGSPPGKVYNSMRNIAARMSQR